VPNYILLFKAFPPFWYLQKIPKR